MPLHLRGGGRQESTKLAIKSGLFFNIIKHIKKVSLFYCTSGRLFQLFDLNFEKNLFRGLNLWSDLIAALDRPSMALRLLSNPIKRTKIKANPSPQVCACHR